MEFVKAKKPADVTLEGVSVEFEMRDNALHAVTLIDADGRMLKVAIDSYSMNAYIKAPPRKLTKFRLHGKPLGIVEIDEQFSERHTADSRKDELSKAFGYPSDEDLDLSIEQVEVLEVA